MDATFKRRVGMLTKRVHEVDLLSCSKCTPDEGCGDHRAASVRGVQCILQYSGLWQASAASISDRLKVALASSRTPGLLATDISPRCRRYNINVIDTHTIVADHIHSR